MIRRNRKTADKKKENREKSRKPMKKFIFNPRKNQNNNEEH